MKKGLVSGLAICCLVGAATLSMGGDEGVGEQIGKKIDTGLSELKKDLQEGWEHIRQSLNEMGVQGRVYGRLHWDKSLEHASIDINIQNGDVVVLKGTVPTSQAKMKAETLANETIGVGSGINELAVK